MNRLLRFVPVVVGVVAFWLSDWMLSDWIVLHEPEIRLADELESGLPPIPANPAIVLVTVQPTTRNRYGASSSSVGFPRKGYVELFRHVASFEPSVVVLDVDLSRATKEEADVIDRTLKEHPSVRLVVPMPPKKVLDQEGQEVDQAEVTTEVAGGLAVRFEPLPLKSAPNLLVGNSLDYPGLVSTGIVPYRTDFETGKPVLHVAALAAASYTNADVSKAETSSDQTALFIGHLHWELGGDQDVATRYPQRFRAFPELSFDEAMAARPTKEGVFSGKLVVIGDNRPEVDRHETPPFGTQSGVMFVAHNVNSLLLPQKLVAKWVPEGVQNAVGMVFGILAAAAFFPARQWIRIVLPVVLAVVGWYLPHVLIRSSALRFDPLILPVTVVLAASVCSAVLALRSGIVDVRTPGEIQIATVLFVDLRGSTELTRDVGGRAVQQAVGPFIAACEKSIRAAGGTLERTTGDGFVATFPNKSRKNSAAACLDVVPKIQSHAEAASRSLGRPFEVKAGMECGPVTGGYVPEQGRQSWSTAGNTINFAARLLDACTLYDCRLAIGPVAAAMVSEDVPLRSLGPFEPKGFEQTVSVFTLDPPP